MALKTMRTLAEEKNVNDGQRTPVTKTQHNGSVTLRGKSTQEEIRAIMQMQIDYIDNSAFRRKNAEIAILQPMPLSEKECIPEELPTGLDPYIKSLYRIPLLTKEQEVHQFRAMNFLKFRASALRKKLPHSINGTTAELLERIPADLEQSQEVRNHLIQSNLRLVVPLAKKFTDDRHDLHEMIILGNDSLMRAVDKFDYGRGYKFSTYATRAIMQNFPRDIHKEDAPLSKCYTGRMRTHEDEEQLDIEPIDTREDVFVAERIRMRHHQIIRTLFALLDQRECSILMARYGIRADMDDTAESLTLEETGKMFKVTRERARQIEAKALVRLRKVMKDEDLDVLAEATEPFEVLDEQMHYFSVDETKMTIPVNEVELPFEIIRP